jgi:hypothetical protein
MTTSKMPCPVCKQLPLHDRVEALMQGDSSFPERLRANTHAFGAAMAAFVLYLTFAGCLAALGWRLVRWMWQ